MIDLTHSLFPAHDVATSGQMKDKRKSPKQMSRLRGRIELTMGPPTNIHHVCLKLTLWCHLVRGGEQGQSLVMPSCHTKASECGQHKTKIAAQEFEYLKRDIKGAI
jgi:hypothetical protein